MNGQPVNFRFNLDKSFRPRLNVRPVTNKQLFWIVFFDPTINLYFPGEDICCDHRLIFLSTLNDVIALTPSLNQLAEIGGE